MGSFFIIKLQTKMGGITRGELTRVHDPFDYDTVVNFCIVFITCCFIAAIVTGLYLFYARFRTQYRAKRTARLEERYGLLLTGIIFDEEDEDFEEKRRKLVKHFRKTYLRSHFNKRVLRKELLKLHKSFSGSSQTVLRNLYLELLLHKDALRDLQNTDWSIRADAVKELSQMQYTEVKPRMLKLSSHENPVLRLEAQAAFLALERENPFGFLETAKAELSEWQQLNLEEIAKRMDSERIPLFSKWFGLKNPTAVQFCIKMTSAFNQFESGPALIQLLKAKDQRVVKESIKAIGNLFIEDAKDQLIALYPDSDAEIQNEIILSLGKLASGDVLEFLTNLLYHAPYEQAMKAGSAMRLSGPDGDDVLRRAAQSNDERVMAIAQHMLDERI